MSSGKIIENMVLKSTDNNHLYRVLWVSSEGVEVYVFNMETLDMPFLVTYTDLQQQIDNGSMFIEPSDLYLTIHSDDMLTEKEKKVRDEAWEIMCHIVSDEPKG